MEEVRQAGVGDRLCEALGEVGRTWSFTPVNGELCKVLSRGGMTRLRCSLVPSGCCKGNRPSCARAGAGRPGQNQQRWSRWKMMEAQTRVLTICVILFFF